MLTERFHFIWEVDVLNNLVPVVITSSEFLCGQIKGVVALVGMVSTVIDRTKDPCVDAFLNRL